MRAAYDHQHLLAARSSAERSPAGGENDATGFDTVPNLRDFMLMTMCRYATVPYGKCRQLVERQYDHVASPKILGLVSLASRRCIVDDSDVPAIDTVRHRHRRKNVKTRRPQRAIPDI